jgi:cysteinyl-tRNA synthetase
VDLIFPHHENEIAQSEGATGEPFVRCWMHGEFLTVEGTKMSKRFGNILTARDLKEEGVDAAAVRMLVFSTHYRKQLSFSDRALSGFNEGIRGLGEFRERLARVAGNAKADPTAGASLDTEFRAAMDDDLNAPQAVAAVFSFTRKVNRELDGGATPSFAAGALAAFDRVMGVLDLAPSAVAVDPALVAWIEERIAARQQARRAGDYKKADAIRAELAARGVEIEDTSAGTRWKLRSS